MSWLTPKVNWSASEGVSNVDLNRIEGNILDLATYQTAGGTATALTVVAPALVNGMVINFTASLSNGAAASTLNGKPFYKPATTAAPKIVAGRYYTAVYNVAGTCFFVKASATGTATPAQVLATVPFSNEDEADLVGTMTNHEADNAGGAVNGTLTAGRVYIRPAQGYWNGGYFTYWDDPEFVSSSFRADKNVFGLQGSIPVMTPTLADSVASAGIMVYGSWGDGKNYVLMNGISGKYFDGSVSWLRNEQPDLMAANFLATKTVCGITGSIKVHSSALNRITASPYYDPVSTPGTLYVKPEAGWYDGIDSYISMINPNPTVTTNAAAPSGGVDGDYWIQP
jgi:hypothetical protein